MGTSMYILVVPLVVKGYTKVGSNTIERGLADAQEMFADGVQRTQGTHGLGHAS